MSDDIDLQGALGEWLVSSIGTEAKLLSGKRLVCGPAWPVYVIEAEISDRPEKFVVRLFNNEKFMEPDLAWHEARVLDHVKDLPIPTPRLIAFCPDDTVCGHPVLLMSYLDGQVELKPGNLGSWLSQLAEALADIHRIPPKDLPWRYSSTTKEGKLRVPDWSQYGDLWQKAIEIRLAGPPACEDVFIHRDYHPVNLLWSSGQMAGVVDWHKGCVGPASVDVAHCCINLATLYGPRAVNTFQEAYASFVDSQFFHDPFWDLETMSLK